jgi:hypothetical protein
MPKSVQSLIWLLLAGALIPGCAASRPRRVVLFPERWPSSLDAGFEQASAHATNQPTVWVEPFVLEADAFASLSAAGEPTGEVLTRIFVERLLAAGVSVSSRQPVYVFSAVVPQLGYVEQGGFPRRITYFSRLVYRLTHRATGQRVWDGNLEQNFEQTVLVNTMTRLPAEPNAYERVLLEKCIRPTWGFVAADVRKMVEKEGRTP